MPLTASTGRLNINLLSFEELRNPYTLVWEEELGFEQACGCRLS
jgi:diaminopimelate epimerase